MRVLWWFILQASEINLLSEWAVTCKAILILLATCGTAAWVALSSFIGTVSNWIFPVRLGFWGSREAHSPDWGAPSARLVLPGSVTGLCHVGAQGFTQHFLCLIFMHPQPVSLHTGRGCFVSCGMMSALLLQDWIYQMLRCPLLKNVRAVVTLQCNACCVHRHMSLLRVFLVDFSLCWEATGDSTQDLCTEL